MSLNSRLERNQEEKEKENTSQRVHLQNFRSLPRASLAPITSPGDLKSMPCSRPHHPCSLDHTTPVLCHGLPVPLPLAHLSSASLGLADSSQVDMLTLRRQFVKFGRGKSRAHQIDERKTAVGRASPFPEGTTAVNPRLSTANTGAKLRQSPCAVEIRH